ncbi:hypothetical protein Pelo_11976 [Pelomyxa schiedti]|nr:hypothetical protein Pelo_11976 [Pelomyxa schiedti]
MDTADWYGRQYEVFEEQGYLCPSVLVPQRETMRGLAGLLTSRGCRRAASVGCGACVWEFCLAEWLEGLLGVDVVDSRIDLVRGPGSKVSFVLAAAAKPTFPVAADASGSERNPEGNCGTGNVGGEDFGMLPEIPADHGLISFFPVLGIPLEEYIRRYRGRIVMMVTDHAYSRLGCLKDTLRACGTDAVD